ncbi:DUF4214 domain-containing protein [Massilia sp. G4R7]|uniref:DUF4214 domain-containing protein n=1 Tax=Massilia phyllostachyos TaxID=2898585 RepID=A0ABS8Q3S9_9BURK|nr:DUF4214 domain-containing protein [Massilia phyllostachyos]MCD2515300.1 DUF4214 domain-containing protein [Massilia phyllostachyos]
MAVYTEAIQKLYVAYFNRPADYEGLAHWERVLTNNNGNINFVSSFFAQSNEYKDQNVGKSYFQIVNQIYQNLFNRDADVGGLEFWADKLRTGTFTVDQIVKVIADTASDAGIDKDKTTYANKVKAATAFTAELNTASEIIGYGGTAANNAAKVWLSGIGTDASLTAATQPAALAATVTAIAQTGTQAGGTSYTLTKGLDNFLGTSGSDTFVASIDNTNAELNTLSSIDIINGGTGIDFLKVQHAGGAVTLGNLSNVEIVQIDSASSTGVEVDSTNTTGVTELAILKSAGSVKATAGTATDITLSARELSAAGAHQIIGGKNVTVTATEMGAAADADTITVGTGTAATGNVVVNAAGKAYDAAVGNLTMGAIKVTGGTTITVNQTAATSMTAAAADTTASKMTQGAVDVITNAATTTVNVKQTADVAAKNGTAASVGGANEVATVKFGALKNGDSITMNGLTFKANADLTANEVAAAFANLVANTLPVAGDTQAGGAFAKGTYTNVFDTTKWTSGAATGDTVVFTSASKNTNVTDLNDASLVTFTNTSTNSTAPTFTIVQGVAATATGAVTGGVMGVETGKVVIDASSAAALKTVTVDGYTAADSKMMGTGSTGLATLNLLNGGDFGVGQFAETFAINLTNVGMSTDVASLDLDSSLNKTLNVTSNGANFANLDLGSSTLTNALNVSGTGLLTATGSTLANVATIKVTGSAGLDLGSVTARTNVTSVDTTGTTGDTTISINGTSSYAGGAGKDMVTIANATAAMGKSINLGAGDDTLNITTVGTIAIPTVDLKGGDGRDTIMMSADNAIALSKNGDFAAKMDGFEVLSIDKANTSGTINLANLDNINYVISGNSAGSTATKSTFSLTVTNGATAGDQITFDGKTLTVVGNPTAAQLASQLAGLTFPTWEATGSSNGVITFVAKTAGTSTVVPVAGDFTFNDADNSGTPATFGISQGVNGVAAGAAAALTIDNLASGGTLELTAAGSGAMVNIKDAGTGTADVLNIVAKATGLGTVTANNVETINIAADAASSLTVAGNSSLTAINVTGSKALGLTLAATDTNVATVNASAATGALTLDLSAHNGVAVTVTGGSGADKLTASAGVNGHADVLIGGAGTDTLVAGSNGARLTGGAGNDLFILSAGTKEANTYSIITDMQAGDLLQLKAGATASAAGTTNVSVFAKLSASLNESTSVFSNYVDAAIAQAKVGEAVWFAFGGNSYVVIDNGTPAGGGVSEVTTFENGVDAIIQIAGVNTLDGVSFNSTYGTIGLV